MGQERVIRTVVADDHTQFRRGLRTALEGDRVGIEVVGEAASGQEAIEVVASTQPDVAILDVRMPDMTGIAAARIISAQMPEVRILMLTVSDEPEDVARALGAGASGYLLKDRSLEEIADAVIALFEGRSWPAAIA